MLKHIAIIGGGIAGLATAYYLHERGRGAVEYTIIESATRWGGKIVSVREQGFVVEGGPDSFITYKTAALELCRALGLSDQLISTNDAARRVFVWSRGQLRQMPDGVMLIVPTQFTPFLHSSLISWQGKLRMGMEAFIPPRGDDGDESLSHFVRRRLGAEALDKIAEPMIAGIYVADAEHLSLQSTFPRLLDMEKKYGSLLRGVLEQKRASNGKTGGGKPAVSMFMTLRGGLQELVDSLVARLQGESLRLNRAVVSVTRVDGAYSIALSDGARLDADEVVFATPAYTTADLIQPLAPALASQLRALRYVSTATVSLGFNRAELNHSLGGFGFVVPRREKRRIIACSWSSTKFNHRAPQGYALVRVFIGGARAEHLAEQDDATLAQIAREELREMMGIIAPPVLTRVYRWRKANPQYEVGYSARIAEIESLAAAQRGLHLVGSAYHGVGIPDCIESAKHVAEKILEAQ